jgi:hypothetical protein
MLQFTMYLVYILRNRYSFRASSCTNIGRATQGRKLKGHVEICYVLQENFS